MLLEKIPMPVPSDVLLSVMVGIDPVLQQTPRAITVAPPSEVILPPLIAVVIAISITSDVVNTGGTLSSLQLLVRTNITTRKNDDENEILFFIFMLIEF